MLQADVQFLAPVRGGDLIEVEAQLVRIGRRSRQLNFELRVVARANPSRSKSASGSLTPALVATTASGVVVVP